ncbi:hypothetical protein LJC36_04860, partial [Desulfovibrio sp. OttesenSCG-928-C14]|nr:hypothetical protein [Desulfovibrio sp. OttesenSCG-928-C14]
MALDEASALGFTTPFSLFDPTAILPRAIHIEPGAYVNAGAVIGSGSRLGPFVFINRRA